MQLHATVRKNQYQDSVRLMQISRQAASLPGVVKVLALLGTDSNKKILNDLGLMDDTVSAATPNDLVICVEAESDEAVGRAVDDVDARLKSVAAASGQAAEARPTSIEEAVTRLPGANLAMISLPGQFAKLDVAQALKAGLNVMLFSDNISMEDEAELKSLAVERGLLLMGPDCGTAIVNGIALALANVVCRGDIGLAAASGTGIQEVTCLIDRFGGGVSHAIGVGGRDLRRQIGGIMMRQAIRTLAKDPGTKRLILLSKPGAPEVMKTVLDEAKASGKPVVACLLGGDNSGPEYAGMTLVGTLEAAAFAAMGQPVPELVISPELRQRVHALAPERRHLRGLFSGGTLCYEALFLLKDAIPVESNVALTEDLKLHYPAKGARHCCVDLGEDEFTQGRPHPIIDLGLRLERMAEDMADPTVRAILLDVVLGYGAHPDPAAELSEAIGRFRRGLADGGPVILAHVCGTDADPQNMSRQEEVLRQAGVFLYPTNALAARAALAVIRADI